MTGKIFITGDKHGSFLPIFGLAEKNKVTEKDILIIAGDAGYVWNEDYQYKLDTLEQAFPGIIAFIDGNHENHRILNEHQEEIWNGGRVHRLSERVFHMMRGEIFNIYEKSYFVFGGARSVDKDRRVEGESWWAEEEPSQEELDYGTKQLREHRDGIDYVITHETPRFARDCIDREKPIDDDYMIPALMDKWYEIIKDGKGFKKWYFGHMHVDQEITAQLRALHTDIRLIETDEIIKWG